MKKLYSLFIVVSILLTGCASSQSSSKEMLFDIAKQKDSQKVNYKKLDDSRLLSYIDKNIYTQLIKKLGDKYCVENVEAKYYSQEYIEELNYNSQSNVYFGYDLNQLKEQFKDERFIFTFDDSNKTVVKKFEKYDDTLERIAKNVAIGTGVILISVTVSLATAGTAPAVSAIFAVAAETGTEFALSSGIVNGMVSGAMTGIKTKNLEKTLKSAALSASEGYKWGAIIGSVKGGGKKAFNLHIGTKGGLTMNQVSQIQNETNYSIDIIKGFRKFEEYKLYKKAGCKEIVLKSGVKILAQNIDFDYINKKGISNMQLVKKGKAAIDTKSNLSYELHHIGQKADSVIAILTKEQHMQNGNNAILHDNTVKSTVEHGPEWQAQKRKLWKEIAEYAQS